ncbi:hypothetical protein SDC9_156111 [bioreactor metagenome]|uniref:Uncharacterized protein n=1 Tax=bioreactor metagenome TaxID=1076179 RepID=A0A645F3C8_9ZZZZ
MVPEASAVAIVIIRLKTDQVGAGAANGTGASVIFSRTLDVRTMVP